ncbi:Uncharacterised protein [Actinobacillus equuli]|nr:Uncharacterised protein [Actinobacillus equuli]
MELNRRDFMKANAAIAAAAAAGMTIPVKMFMLLMTVLNGTKRHAVSAVRVVVYLSVLKTVVLLQRKVTRMQK